ISGEGRGQNTVSLPALREGRVALCFGAALARVNERGSPDIDFGSPAQAYAIAQGHLAYYHGLAEQGIVRLITNRAALDAHMAEWGAWDAETANRVNIENDERPAPSLGIVISMECADPILAPAQVPAWFDHGLRVIGPAHYGRGRYVGGTGTNVGFNEQGVELLRAMERAGMILDVTHLSDEAFWQALGMYRGVILASHHNCRALVSHQRQLSDEQIRALIERDAVIGAAFDVWMLTPDWSMGRSSNRQVSLATIAEHIDHVCQLAGDSEHAAIGSDLDGGFGREQSPHDLDTIADVQSLADALADRDFGDEHLPDNFFKNWLRLIPRAWSDTQ